MTRAALGPFHNDDRCLGKCVLESEHLYLRGFTDPVEVYVNEARSTVVFGHERVRRAGYVVDYTQLAGDSLRENGLAASKRSAERDDQRSCRSRISVSQSRHESGTEIAHLFWRGDSERHQGLVEQALVV